VAARDRAHVICQLNADSSPENFGKSFSVRQPIRAKRVVPELRSFKALANQANTRHFRAHQRYLLTVPVILPWFRHVAQALEFHCKSLKGDNFNEARWHHNFRQPSHMRHSPRRRLGHSS
jgi:hypothetical protein